MNKKHFILFSSNFQFLLQMYFTIGNNHFRAVEESCNILSKHQRELEIIIAKKIRKEIV